MPRRQLFGFKRLTLSAGATATVQFPVEADMMSLVDQAGRRWVAAGSYHVLSMSLTGCPRVWCMTRWLAQPNSSVSCLTAQSEYIPCEQQAQPRSSLWSMTVRRKEECTAVSGIDSQYVGTNETGPLFQGGCR